MNDAIPNIINTKLVPAHEDIFWKDNEAITKNSNPLPTLIISIPFTDPAHEAQLQKMMQACQLQPADYNLIFLANDQEFAWHKLREKLHPENIILLGINPVQLGVSVYFMPHQVNRFDERNFLPTLSIPELEQHPDVKKHLWNYGLKPVFVEHIYKKQT